MLPIIESAKQEILDALRGFSSSFETWKLPWTQERAEKIDEIGSGVNTVIDRGSVKRIVRGYIAWNHTGWSERILYGDGSAIAYERQISTKVTIPAVNMSKSMVLVDVIHKESSERNGHGVAFLNNATTLEIRLPNGLMNVSQSYFREVNYQVVEFY